MIVSTYYNQENNVVLMSTAKKATSHEVNGEVTILKNGDEVVGVNIFNPTFDVKPGLNDSKSMPSEYTALFDAEIENPFEVGFVKLAEAHPKSEKLNVCQIELSSGETQIVCGASNMETGIKVIVAKVGSVMPNGMSIVPSQLIDVPSNGMVCSLRELGRTQKTPGIEILNDDFALGQDYL